MKEGSMGDPNMYLGGKLKRMTLDNGIVAWSLSSSKYIQEVVRNIELYPLEISMEESCQNKWQRHSIANIGRN
jgi:hypothetical protein